MNTEKRLTVVPAGERSIPAEALDDAGAMIAQASGIVHAVQSALHCGGLTDQKKLASALWAADELLTGIKGALQESDPRQGEHDEA